MTFDQYIQNPMGKNNAVFSQRELFRNLYTNKLDKILVREGGKIDYTTFIDQKTGKYYIYFKIPSEVINKFYYDVIVEFYSDNPLTKGQQTLKDYNVRFFSNDPAFVFTFCHAFITNDMFIKDFTPKMSKLAVKNTGVVRNPKNETGYVKSIFFAYLVMKSRGLFNKLQYTLPYNSKQILGKIMHADEKIQLRQQAQADNDAELKKQKALAQNKKANKADIQNQLSKSFETDAVKLVQTSKVIGKTKSGRVTKSVKTVKRK